MRIFSAIFLGLTTLCAEGSRAETVFTRIRQPGSRLDLSIRQEADIAVSRGRTWLEAQLPVLTQPSDRAQAVVALRLTAPTENAPPLTPLDRQVLSQPPAGDAVGRSWQLLAAGLLPETITRTNRIAQLSSAALEFRSPAEHRFWLLACSAAGVDVPPPPIESTSCQSPVGRCAEHLPVGVPSPADRALLQLLADDWPQVRRQSDPAFDVNQGRWLVAQFILAAGNGTLPPAAGRMVPDWRADLAADLIGSQRRCAITGGGYWTDRKNAPSLPETVYALLTLQSL